MNKRPTKKEVRNELDSQVREYLDKGGQLEQVPRGASGRYGQEGPIKPESLGLNEPKETRTLVTDVIATIEARKHPEPVPKKPKQTRLKKKMIYDDFGEPLRWEWVEE